MAMLELKATHKPIREYYGALRRFDDLGIKHEGAVRSAFQTLLEHYGRQREWTLVPEWRIRRAGKHSLYGDGALLDRFGLNHGIWEAKDTNDDLATEIKAKFSAGYPKDNILFQEPRRAILYQQGERVFEGDLTRADDLVYVLKLFLEYSPPAIAEWEKAVEEFKDKVPQLGASLAGLIDEQRGVNRQFTDAFASFLNLCRGSLNPNLSEAAVEEMIIQHLLTERIFRKVFAVADFVQRNTIAQEIEKVVTALTSKAFSRDDFVKSLDHFYGAIENAAATIHDFSEKQTFLNTVYERFFQGFSVKVADTHGIVYTPQPIVDFMVASVEHVLRSKFGKTLGDAGVHILDPFTGTGNFIVNIMRRIPRTSLAHKYREELHCNEVMLLPYYVASMNIEHAYYEAVGQYEPFEGICLVDTFQTAEESQAEFAFFNERNSERVQKQKKAPIRVIIANPPYNAGQVNENDNNKNRKYPDLDRRVSNTYGKASEATLLRKLSDPYVKAIRYASDRIGKSGIVCFVNNNSFVGEKTFDGMRKELMKDFDLVYILDLGGNVRKNPKLSGTTHNVFGIQVGVSINLFVRLPGKSAKKQATQRRALVRHQAVPTDWRKEQKYVFLETRASITKVRWRQLEPDEKGNWLTNDTDEQWDQFLPIACRTTKAEKAPVVVFHSYSLGASTNRDGVVYGFDRECLAKRVEEFTEDYNAELRRLQAKDVVSDIDDFVSYEKVKWSETLKRHLLEGREATFAAKRIRQSLYRPFTKMKLYYDPQFVDRPGAFDKFLPTPKSEKENLILLVPSAGARSPFWCCATRSIPNLNFVSIDSAQSLPIYTYSDDGKDRRDNITPQVVSRFQKHYADPDIAQPDIFHFCYAMLHHPAYRQRYGENLKHSLPRIPFISEGAVSPPLDCTERSANQAQADRATFWEFAKAGKRLIDLHVNYERQDEYPLQRMEAKDVALNWRVEKMKLSKDRRGIRYNDFLTLVGIPAEVFDYRLGNRSSLEWVIDQYCITRDQHGNIVCNPNRSDDEQYIVRLIGQVITVSLETLKIIASLPELRFP
jgi:predicted helicase